MLRLKSILQYSNIIFILFIITIIISFVRCNIKTYSKYSLNDDNIKGTLIDKKIDGNKLSFIIKGKEKVKCTYYLNSEEEKDYYDNIDLGITLELNGSLNIPSNNTIPNTFNYKEYLYYNHIHLIMNVDNINVINNKTSIFYSIKNMIIEYINTFISRGYLSTFILGDKNLLEDEVYDNYQTLGVSHIFAISGMHISIICMLLMKLLYKTKENIRYLIIIVFLLFYIFITNYSPSVIRSITLFILLYINKKYDFCLDNNKVYYLTIMLILIINPYFLYNVGFLYSSVISYTLIAYSNLINGNKILSLLKISIISFLVSIPITINTNYEINVLSIINNLFFVPLISVVVYPFSLLTLFIKPLDNMFYSLMNLIELISKYALVYKIIIPKMTIIIIIIYYVILYIIFNTYNKRYLLLLILLLGIWKYHYVFDNYYYVYYLNVGQGDSSIVRYKNDVIMIDTGGKTTYKVDEWKKQKEYYYTDNSIKLLKSIGCDDIDLLILTHGDQDHLGESVHLINNFKVNSIKVNKGSYNNKEKEILNIINNMEVNIDIPFEYLDSDTIYDNENDNSVITLFKLYNYNLLYMGDASKKNELELINRYKLNIDILKVGHHGSNTSSDESFIKSIKPIYSIISVGKNNKYGHPNKEVLDILSNSNIYRTDIDGSIIFKINKTLSISTYPP